LGELRDALKQPPRREGGRHLYVGTSLGADEALGIVGRGWTINSPIQRCGITTLIESYPPGLAVIVDGLYHSVDSVSISEIRDALRRGWLVVGVSSLGALRAVEARTLGMFGFGRVYRWLSLFRVEDDDEVAQAVHPDTFKPLSDAMVDIRAFLSAACRQGLMRADDAAKIRTAMKSLFFPERTLRRACEQVRSGPVERLALERFAASFIGPKRRDATELLDALSELGDVS
jgi:hypothetical protein